ncbi:hypothetical protein HQ865_23415 [Mucilaginibacter mali]|uniref:Uncharacterized protein n=1 Tax=Mucilaginibacter mali TaxID=2740462 RepID=A0A7D4Q3Y9_9SPHI|nr:hypothetical protein [Mucilaginibacter mali]QKJ32586.1 hypothetical protein HQ865_23415 [Mucilaginibacter mali]
MKNQKKFNVSKLMARFDEELKNILVNDLSARNNHNQLVSTIQNSLNNRLKAA